MSHNWLQRNSCLGRNKKPRFFFLFFLGCLLYLSSRLSYLLFLFALSITQGWDLWRICETAVGKNFSAVAHHYWYCFTAFFVFLISAFSAFLIFISHLPIIYMFFVVVFFVCFHFLNYFFYFRVELADLWLFPNIHRGSTTHTHSPLTL